MVLHSREYDLALSLIFFHQLSVGLQDIGTEDYHMSTNIDQTVTLPELQKFGQTLIQRYCPCEKKHRRVKVVNALGMCENCGVHFYFRLTGLSHGHWYVIKDMLKQFDYKHAEYLLKNHYKNVKL